MLDAPKEICRLYKPLDLWGWFMSILGLILLCKFGGVGWIFGTDKNWWYVALVFFIFSSYAIRVSFGRVYKIVYYDTILNPMYELEIDDHRFFVNARNEEELKIYINLNYPGLEYKVIETHTESFIKIEQHI